MGEKIKPCALGPRHKWVWKKDTTTYSGTFSISRARAIISRRGVYECKCGARKYGEARSGL